MARQNEIPVYLFLGFLEGGKTRFIQETMEDPRFDSGDKTLLLVCEEGEEEYDEERFAFGGVQIEVLDNKAQCNPEYLDSLIQKTGAGRVVLEYNGMWPIAVLDRGMPENWVVYQSIAVADGNTFRMYFQNMRQMMLDKIANAELLVVNRADSVKTEEDHQAIHKAVRQASRSCDIAYEYLDGSVEYDDIPDPLPFDINAPIIEIQDNDFGIWYMDCNENPQNYEDKTVCFTAQVCQTPRAGRNSFVPGRFAMTCCEADIEFVGFPCEYSDYKSLEQRSWIKLTAKVHARQHALYGGEGPVLTAVSVEPAQAPENDVVTFS